MAAVGAAVAGRRCRAEVRVDFGYRADGPEIGILMGLKSAVFCSIMAGAVLARLLPVRQAQQDDA